MEKFPTWVFQVKNSRTQGWGTGFWLEFWVNLVFTRSPALWAREKLRRSLAKSQGWLSETRQTSPLNLTFKVSRTASCDKETSVKKSLRSIQLISLTFMINATHSHGFTGYVSLDGLALDSDTLTLGMFNSWLQITTTLGINVSSNIDVKELPRGWFTTWSRCWIGTSCKVLSYMYKKQDT